MMKSLTWIKPSRFGIQHNATGLQILAEWCGPNTAMKGVKGVIEEGFAEF